MSNSTQITIATYNIFLSINQEEIVKNVLELNAKGITLLCLQEVVRVPGRAFVVDEILKRLGRDWSASCHLGDGMSPLDAGVCIIWKKSDYIAVETKKILLPKVERLQLHEMIFDWLLGHKGIPIQRRSICVTFRHNKEEILVINTHLDNVGGQKNRLKQIAYLLNATEEYHCRHQIICGDFNTFDLLKTGEEKLAIQDEFGKEFIDAADSVSWTADIYNINIPEAEPLLMKIIKVAHIHIRRKLDYIWVKGFQVVQCSVVKVAGSDHFPVIAKIKF